MAARKSGSSVFIIAVVIAVLIAGVLAFVSLSGGDGKPKDANAAAAPTPASATPTATATATPTPAPALARVRGRVLNADSNPEPDQKVYIIEKVSEKLEESVRRGFADPAAVRTVATNADGEFDAEVAPKKTWIFGLMIAGEPQAVTQEVTAENISARPEVSLSVPAVYELRGTASLPSGDVLEGVPISIDWKPTTLLEKTPDAKRETVSTGEDGRFSINLREVASVSVTVDSSVLPEPFLYGHEPIVLGPDEFGAVRTYRVDLEIVEGLTVKGKVVDAEEKGLAGAEVRLAAEGMRTANDSVGLSDAEGNFEIRMVYPRVYTISAKRDGFNKFIRREFDPVREHETTIAMDRHAVVRGVVMMEDAQFETVKLSILDQYDGKQTSVSLGEDGTAPFEFPGMQPARYMICAETSRDGLLYYAEKVVEVGGGDSGAAGEIMLRPMGSCKGQMTGAAPADGYTSLVIRATPENSPEGDFPAEPARGSWRRAPYATTSDTGAFTMENLRGGVTYLLIVKGREANRILGGAVASSSLTEPVQVALGGVGTVTGRVLNSRGEACNGSMIKMITGLGTLEGAASQVQERQTYTDYNGVYNFAAVPVGQVRIGVGAEGAPTQLITVREETESAVDLTCRDFVAIVFDVRAGSERPFQPNEQFLILPRPGTETLQTVRELSLTELRADLEPGKYTITRTATMESRAFEVNPRLDGAISIDFGPKTQ